MSPRGWRPVVKGLDPGAQPGSWVPEGPPLGQDPQASVFGWGRGREGASVRAGQRARVTQRGTHPMRRRERLQNNRLSAVSQGRVRAR